MFEFVGLYSSEYGEADCYELDLSSCHSVEECQARIREELDGSFGFCCDNVVFNVYRDDEFVFSGVADGGVEFGSVEQDISLF